MGMVGTPNLGEAEVVEDGPRAPWLRWVMEFPFLQRRSKATKAAGHGSVSGKGGADEVSR
jgi:hypothetical protein